MGSETNSASLKMAGSSSPVSSSIARPEAARRTSAVHPLLSRRGSSMRCRPRPLDVYRPIEVLRDELVTKTIFSEQMLGKLLTGEVPEHLKVINIPAPPVNRVAAYENILSKGYSPPTAYVRAAVQDVSLEKVAVNPDTGPVSNVARIYGYFCASAGNPSLYEIDAEDETWIKKRSGCSVGVVEKMLYAWECATARGFPPNAKRCVEIARAARISAQSPSFIAELHEYWISKRTRMKKPLLRAFWPLTSHDDANPHEPFDRARARDINCEKNARMRIQQ